MTDRHAARFLRLAAGALATVFTLTAVTLWAVGTLGGGLGVLVSWGPLWALAARTATTRAADRRDARLAAVDHGLGGAAEPERERPSKPIATGVPRPAH